MEKDQLFTCANMYSGGSYSNYDTYHNIQKFLTSWIKMSNIIVWVLAFMQHGWDENCSYYLDTHIQ